MNIAIIFAGGVGKRMGNKELPKQFIKTAKKPIIIHTLEKFEKNKNIDKIVISCVEGWVDYLKELIQEYKKQGPIRSMTILNDGIVLGGSSGQLSIFNGLNYAYENFKDDSIVLIHDGVRPFINDDLINESIETVKQYGSSVACVPSIETFLIVDENKKVTSVPERKNSLIAKAPQCFVLKDIYKVHLQAQKDGITNSIDSCTLMNYYNKKINVILTDYDNIKITTPKDLKLAESIYKRILKDTGDKDAKK